MKKMPCFALAVLLLSATGCSGSALRSASGEDGAVLALTDFAGRQVYFQEYPKKIVALSNGETDIVYALGGELVGRPASTVPLANKEAEQVATIGTAHEVDLEQISLLRADVVLGNNPMNAKDIPVIEGIGSKIILTSANSVDEIKRQITLFGELLGQEDKAGELLRRIDVKIAELAGNPLAGNPRALLVYGAPGTFMAALPDSLSGNILELAGGVNIASDYPRLQSYPQYAQMNSERIVEADPQAIFIMTHGDPELVRDSFTKEMRTNSAWNSIAAVKNNRVEVLPAELFGTNPGSRIIEALAYMREKLEAAGR